MPTATTNVGETLGQGWTFRRRAPRPATDPVNALLGFGYALAIGEVARSSVREAVASARRGGGIPGADGGRFTLGLLNRWQLEREDFEEHEDGAVRLTPEGRRR